MKLNLNKVEQLRSDHNKGHRDEDQAKQMLVTMLGQ